jgi:hypothetical protein
MFRAWVGFVVGNERWADFKCSRWKYPTMFDDSRQKPPERDVRWRLVKREIFLPDLDGGNTFR